MKVWGIELDTLPKNAQEVIASEEYFQFLLFFQNIFQLSNEQNQSLDVLMGDLFEKKFPISELIIQLRDRLHCTEDVARNMAIEIMINTILIFPDIFGDQKELFEKIGGMESDINRSKTLSALLVATQDIFKEAFERVDSLDFGQQELFVKNLFRSQLTNYLYEDNPAILGPLNNLIFEILRRNPGIAVDFIQALLENEESIGSEKIVREGVRYESTVIEWIHDLLVFSGPDGVSTLTIAKYVTQSPNVRKCIDRDRQVLRKLFETFYILKNFPDSLEKIHPSAWMIIPYRLEEEGIKQGIGQEEKQDAESRIQNQELEKKSSETPSADTTKTTGTGPSKNVIPDLIRDPVSKESLSLLDPRRSLSRVSPRGGDDKVPSPSIAIQEVDGVPTIVEQGDSRIKNAESRMQNQESEKQIQTQIQVDKSIPQGAKQIPVQIKSSPGAVGKVSMSDVKAPPRLMDAVEELRFMTLKDFRRLSPKPDEAIEKIVQKISLLEKESYTKKMAGIQAWKENEISKLYLQIGQESFGKGSSMEAAIEQRKAANQPYLTPEEFDALLELNEKLRA